ncbi:MAG TPA: ATPase domain-containing protein [Bryobacteraceae bacterium]|nr:ATPase domain-containing protein [Bryobacteraceae bacterium]
MSETPITPPADARVSTGIEGLDDVLGGGFPQGHLFLVEGVPGSGKTTLGLQFLMAGAKRGESALYVTLSESKQEIQKVARSHGWSLEGIAVFEYTPTEDMLRAEDQYSAFHPSEIEFQDTTKTILDRVEEIQPRRIVLDSLSELRLLARDSLRYRRQVLALKHFFTTRNCTVLLLDDRTSGQQDLQLQSIAHGVLMLEKVPRDFGNSRRRIEVEKMRGSMYREGHHDYVIRTGGVVVYPRLISGEHAEQFVDEQVSSGIAELDKLWAGGIDRGTSSLLIGPAGSGKSSLAMSYAVAAAQRGEFAAVFLFEEWTKIACRRAAGLGIDPCPYIDTGLLHLEQIDPAELAPGEFVQHVRDSVEKRDAKVVVIDSLNGFLNAMPGEQNLALQMHELLSFLNRRGVVTLVVLAQSGLVGTMTSPVDLSYLADNILLLRFFETGGQIKKALSVVKKRGGDHEESIRELRLSKGQISVGRALTEFRGVLTGVPTYLGTKASLQGTDDQR